MDMPTRQERQRFLPLPEGWGLRAARKREEKRGACLTRAKSRTKSGGDFVARSHPFRFGVICEHMSSADEWVTKARQAEQLGYSTFFIRDHFTREPFGDQLAPMIALMAAADATTTLRVGTLVLDNDYRHPVILAKEAATLDVLSNGRFELGLGAGWAKDEYQQAGMPFDPPGVRVSRFEEALHVIKGLFAQEPLTCSGAHYTIDHLSGFPKPIQQPHPPILIGASGKRMLAIAAREASIIGLLNGDYSTGAEIDDPLKRTPAAMAEKIEWIRQSAGDRFDQIELSTVIAPILTLDQRQGAEQCAREHGWETISPEDVLEMPSIFVGSAEQVVELMEERRERYGISYYIVSDTIMEEFAPLVARLAGK
jgi:probable F420-dependent oxidoreductase